jgi:hypothetical protein
MSSSNKSPQKHNDFREIKIGFGNYAKIKSSSGPKNGS